MEKKELNDKLRSLFCSGNIITVTWDDMRYIVNRFNLSKNKLDIIKSDFDKISFRMA